MTSTNNTTIRRAVLQTVRDHDEPVVRADLPALLSDNPNSDAVEPVVDQLLAEGELYRIELKNGKEVLKKP